MSAEENGMMNHTNSNEILQTIISSAIENDYRGIDPYDFASSQLKLPPFLLSKASFLNKISVLNFRWIFGIRPTENSKANALLLHAMIVSDHIRFGQQIKQLIIWFDENRSKEHEEYSVGFAFEMALNRYSSGPGKTSLIISLFTMFAFMEYYRLEGDLSVLDRVRSFEKLLDDRWLKFEEEESLWYSYQSTIADEVYNATAKIGRFYSELYEMDHDERYFKKIKKILNYLSNIQGIDGTWAYSSNISYVDSFHTAFILESIYCMINTTGLIEFQPMFELGLKDYSNKFFLSGGRPLHFHPDHRPNDIRRAILRTEIRDAANAILLFSRIGDLGRAKEVVEWTVTNFYDHKENYFYFYDNRILTCKIRYMRWQAWMALAISKYLERNEKGL